MTILIVTLLGIVLLFTYGIFAGVITCYFNKAKLFKSIITFGENETKPIYYYVINSNIPFQVIGIYKWTRVLVSEKANLYFTQNTFHGLLLHELGHIATSYNIRRTMYIIIQFVFMFPIFALIFGLWQSLLIFILVKFFIFFFNNIYKYDKHKQEILADQYAAIIMKEYNLLPDLIKGYQELPNLRESDEHPSINQRIMKIYEAIQNKL